MIQFHSPAAPMCRVVEGSFRLLCAASLFVQVLLSTPGPAQSDPYPPYGVQAFVQVGCSADQPPISYSSNTGIMPLEEYYQVTDAFAHCENGCDASGCSVESDVNFVGHIAIGEATMAGRASSVGDPGVAGAAGSVTTQWYDTLEITSSTLANGTPVDLLFKTAVVTLRSPYGSSNPPCVSPNNLVIAYFQNLQTGQTGGEIRDASCDPASSKEVEYVAQTQVGALVPIRGTLRVDVSASTSPGDIVDSVSAGYVSRDFRYEVDALTPGVSYRSASGLAYFTPCPVSVELAAPKLAIANMHKAQQTLKLDGRIVVSEAVDPIANGVRLIVDGANGRRIFDATIPNGQFDSNTKSGWKVNKNGTKWTYLDPIGVEGIVKVTVSKLTKIPGALRVQASAKKAEIAVASDDNPLTLQVQLAPGTAYAGHCGRIDFEQEPPLGPACELNKANTSIKCQ